MPISISAAIAPLDTMAWTATQRDAAGSLKRRRNLGSRRKRGSPWQPAIRLVLLGSGLALCMWPSGRAAEDEPGKVGLRRPVAMALVDGGRKLLVANRDRGTISAIDTTQLKIDSEVQAARRLSHLVGSPKGVVAVTDQDAAEMVLLRYQGGALQAERRRPACLPR